MSDAAYNFLQNIPLFKDLTQDDLIDLLRMLRPVQYHSGEIIFKEGDEGLVAFVIQSGTVEIFVVEEQKSFVVTRFNKGEVFGELALIDGSPRSASARALTECEILCLDKVEFDFLRSQYRPLAFNLLRYFANDLCLRIRDTNDQIEELLVHGKVEQRGGPVIMSARTEPATPPKKRGFFSRLFSGSGD